MLGYLAYTKLKIVTWCLLGIFNQEPHQPAPPHPPKIVAMQCWCDAIKYIGAEIDVNYRLHSLLSVSARERNKKMDFRPIGTAETISSDITKAIASIDEHLQDKEKRSQLDVTVYDGMLVYSFKDKKVPPLGTALKTELESHGYNVRAIQDTVDKSDTLTGSWSSDCTCT